MAKQINVGIGGVVKKVSKVPAAIGGVVKEMKKGVCGVGGVIKTFFESNFLLYNNGEWGNGYGIVAGNTVGTYFTITDKGTYITQTWKSSGSSSAYLMSSKYIDLTKYSKLHIKFRVDNYNDSYYQFGADVYIKQSSGYYSRAGYISDRDASVGTIYDVTGTLVKDTNKEQQGNGFYIKFEGSGNGWGGGAINITLYELWLE